MIDRLRPIYDYFLGGGTQYKSPLADSTPMRGPTAYKDILNLLDMVSKQYMDITAHAPTLDDAPESRPYPMVHPTTTPTPTPAPTTTPMPTATPTAMPSNIPSEPMAPGPTPTLVPDMENPYFDMLSSYFHPDDINRASNTIFGESSFDQMIANINQLGESRRVSGPEELEQIIRDYGSTDVGLAQHNMGTAVGEALLDYMEGLGLELGDLLDPETNIMLMADRLYGKVPRILPGWGQWYTPYATEVVDY